MTRTAIKEIAKAEKINPSCVSRVLRLTLLAPAIVNATLNGSHLPDTSLPALMQPFPVTWTEQALHFGLSIPDTATFGSFEARECKSI
jgi:hypothetical protein